MVAQPNSKIASHYGSMDYLSYFYDGNQLKNVKDTGNTLYGFKDGSNPSSIDDYSYDANGNMTSDYNKGIHNISYNHLNLPTQVNIKSGTSGNIQYVYDATGVKQRKTISTGTTTDYAGNYVYETFIIKFSRSKEMIK